MTLKSSVQAETAASDGKLRGGTTGRGWLPGQSGNPRGRANERLYKGKTLPELARSLTGEALAAIGRVLRDPNAAQALQLQAAGLILQRGWGDAPKASELPQGLQVTVQVLQAEARPVPGVLRSPVAGHVALAAPVAAEVLDVDGSVVCDAKTVQKNVHNQSRRPESPMNTDGSADAHSLAPRQPISSPPGAGQSAGRGAGEKVDPTAQEFFQ